MPAPLCLIFTGLLSILGATASLHAQGDAAGNPLPAISFPEKVNPGLSINSRYAETKPVLSHDGTRLYFARKNHPSNVGGWGDPQDIFISETRDGLHWSAARNPGSAINTPAADNLCSVLDDNTFVFFKSSGRNKGRFSIRRMNSNVQDQAVGPVVANESKFLEATISHDLQVLLFTAKTRDNVAYRSDLDERDIYFSVRTINGWTPPANIGRTINTPGDEFSPFLAADGRTLYFASNGRGGFGGADIFVSRRIGDGWRSWTEPENLGSEINTDGFDGYLTIAAAGRTAYIVSGSNAIGKTDIIAVSLPEKFCPAVCGKWTFMVKDSITGSPLEARVIISENGRKVADGITDFSGRLSLFLAQGNQLRVTVHKENYLALSQALPDSARVCDLHLRPGSTGELPAFGPVMFNKGTANIIPASYPLIDSLADALRQFQELDILLLGHTDDHGSSVALKDLSFRRVEAVRDHLIRKGIAAHRISGKYFGGLKPVVSNSSEESRQRNRRVEVIVKRR